MASQVYSVSLSKNSLQFSMTGMLNKDSFNYIPMTSKQFRIAFTILFLDVLFTKLKGL